MTNPKESHLLPATGASGQDHGVELMLAFQAGEESAFDELVERYSGAVYGLLTRFMGLSEAREDLVQEVFLRVLRARERYVARASFTTWLYRIVFNLCVNARARDRGEQGVGGEEEDIGGLDSRADERTGEPWAALEREDIVQSVRRAIAALPERQRLALILAKYEELSHAEIGEVLGASERAVKSLVHRAREGLRESLAALLPADELAGDGFPGGAR